MARKHTGLTHLTSSRKFPCKSLVFYVSTGTYNLIFPEINCFHCPESLWNTIEPKVKNTDCVRRILCVHLHCKDFSSFYTVLVLSRLRLFASFYCSSYHSDKISFSFVVYSRQGLTWTYVEWATTNHFVGLSLPRSSKSLRCMTWFSFWLLKSQRCLGHSQFGSSSLAR